MRIPLARFIRSGNLIHPRIDTAAAVEMGQVPLGVTLDRDWTRLHQGAESAAFRCGDVVVRDGVVVAVGGGQPA